jgi:hypothetical protein
LGPACKQHVGIAFPRFFFRSSRGASGSSAGLEWQIVAHNEFEGLVRPTEGPELSDDERRNGRGGAGGEAAAAGERPHRGAPPRPEPRAGRLRGRLRHHDPALRRRLRPRRPPPPPRRQGYPLLSPLPPAFGFLLPLPQPSLLVRQGLAAERGGAVSVFDSAAGYGGVVPPLGSTAVDFR